MKEPNEAETSRAITDKNNWKIFFPSLKFIAEKFIIEKDGKNEWKEIDILAFNSAKKRFVIIELKKGKNKKHLEQANEYRQYLQKEIETIYNRVVQEKEYEHILFPPFKELNPAEIILVAESFPDNYSSLINEVPDLILAEYQWEKIDNEKLHLIFNYKNKPSKGKQKNSCIVSLKSIENKPKLKKHSYDILKIIFPDGTVFEERNAIDSFIEAILKIGIKKVQETNEKQGNYPLIIENLGQIYLQRRKNYKKIGECYIYRHHSTEVKEKLLKKITEKLKLNIQVEIVKAPERLDCWNRQAMKRKNENLITKIMKLPEAQLAELSDSDRKMIIDKFKVGK